MMPFALAREKEEYSLLHQSRRMKSGTYGSKGASGDIMRCKTNRLSGSYTSSDWEKASKYTSDAALTAFINRYSPILLKTSRIKLTERSNLGFKNQTPQQLGQPLKVKVKHVGDTWYTPTDKKLYFYVKGNVSQFKNVISKNRVHFWKKGTAPTISNAPLPSWNTSTLKEAHVSDLYYNTAAKKLYIYSKS